MKTFCIIPGISAILFLFCKKEKSDDLEISMGSVCGWYTGSDSLFISAEKTYYKFTELCTTDHFIDKQTSQKECDDLVDLLDIGEFEKINLNTCFSCVDRCDTWICVRHNSTSHQIRFAYFDSLAVSNIQPFIDKMETIRTNILNEIQE
jgi:hypothetical protein